MDIQNSAGVSLPPTSQAVGRARRFALRHLRDWGCDAVAEDARLIVSELVTNMVRHCPHGGFLSLSMADECVRIAMTDHGEGTIEVRHPGPTELGGRGMLIVERLSTRWGVDAAPEVDGRTVWCELAIPR